MRVAQGSRETISRPEFRIGRRIVQPELNAIVTAGKSARVEPKVSAAL